jgi:hypothetical protein
VAGIALPGCFTVDEEEPECTKNSDCDDDEFCSEDDECENSCDAFCKGLLACSEGSLDQPTCEDACSTIVQFVATDACTDATTDLASCFDASSNCTDAADECYAQANAYSAACAVCASTMDGICDEPTLCATGTDSYDCGSSG